MFGLAMAMMPFVGLVATLALIGACFVWAAWLDDWQGIRSYSLFRREIKWREPLSAAAFYRTYYGESSFDPLLVERCRRLLATLWGIPLEKLRPADDFVWFYGDCIRGDLALAVKREFAVTLDDADPLYADASLQTLGKRVAEHHASDERMPASADSMVVSNDTQSALPKRPLFGVAIFLLGFFAVHGLAVLCVWVAGNRHLYGVNFGSGFAVMLIVAKRIARDPMPQAKMICATAFALSIAWAISEWLLDDWFYMGIWVIVLSSGVLALLAWTKETFQHFIRWLSGK